MADGNLGKYHDLLKHEMLPSYLAADPDGDVFVAYGAAGYKGRGSAVSWWRTHPAAEPTAHRVRELPCLTPQGRASRGAGDSGKP